MKCDFCDKEATEMSNWSTEAHHLLHSIYSDESQCANPPNNTCDEHRIFRGVYQKDWVFDYLKDNPGNISSDGFEMWWYHKVNEKELAFNKKWAEEKRQEYDDGKNKVDVVWKRNHAVLIVTRK